LVPCHSLRGLMIHPGIPPAPPPSLWRGLNFNSEIQNRSFFIEQLLYIMSFVLCVAFGLFGSKVIIFVSPSPSHRLGSLHSAAIQRLETLYHGYSFVSLSLSFIPLARGSGQDGRSSAPRTTSNCPSLRRSVRCRRPPGGRCSSGRVPSRRTPPAGF
jgi:hypothetical protein